MSESQALIDSLFKKVIQKGSEVRVSLNYKEYLHDPRLNIQLFTKGFITTTNEQIPEPLGRFELQGEEHDDPPQFLVWNPEAVEIMEIRTGAYNEKNNAPKVEIQERFDLGWKRVGKSKYGVLLMKERPHVVNFPKEILDNPDYAGIIAGEKNV